MWLSVGISGVEEHVYRALLRDPQLTVTEVAVTLELPLQRARTAVRRLVEAGLLERPNGAGPPASGNGPRPSVNGARPRGGLRPVDPRVALGTLIRSRQGELDRLAADVDQLATDFYFGRLSADPSMMVEVLDGDAAICTRLRELLSSAGQDVVLLDAPPYVMDSDECEGLETAALGRGVRYRCLYGTDVLNNADKLSYITGMVRHGEQARLLRTVPLKLIVVDRRVAVLPFTDSEDEDRFRCILVQRSALTDALYALFEVLWRQATAWPTQLSGGPNGSGVRSAGSVIVRSNSATAWSNSTAARPNGTAARSNGSAVLTDEEQVLLSYLAAGLKDEAIARQLACSRRTLRRRVDGLLDKLGASSRFQAGALAAQRGWL